MIPARALLVAVGLVACAEPLEVRDALESIPGVMLSESSQTALGYSYFVLHFEQPADHRNPGGATFRQRVSLLHRSLAAPMVVVTTGYNDYYRDAVHEVTQLLNANQISIEHRYFGESIPPPKDGIVDWESGYDYLTTRQAADDQHRIVSELRRIYMGNFLSVGGSKGGMTATYHRRWYPDDVEGTVAYVTPMSFARGDTRYAEYQLTIGEPWCRDAVRNYILESLGSRRESLVQLYAEEFMRTPATSERGLVNSMIGLEWRFWQYYGDAYCAQVPAVTASIQDFWRFYRMVTNNSGVVDIQPYYYQADLELGYPAADTSRYAAYRIPSDAGDFAPPRPKYDGGRSMRDIEHFITTRGSGFLFVYGEWDPWTAGKYRLGQATGSVLLTVPRGNHRVKLADLPEADWHVAMRLLEQWSGVAPVLPRVLAPERAGREPLGAMLPPPP